MTRSFRIRTGRCVPLLSALLLVAAALGILDPSYAATSTTFSNPAAIQGQAAQRYTENATPINLAPTGTPVGSVYPSTIHVSGMPGSVADLSLDLLVDHTAPDDLDILLVSPSGRTVVLMSDAGGYDDFTGALHFTTSGGTSSLPDTTTFSSTWYQATNWTGNDVGGDVWPAPAPAVLNPNASLTSLRGDTPNGDWKLFVHDDQDQDGGQVATWAVSVVTDAVPTPTTTYPSGLAVSGLGGAVTDVDVTLGGIDWPNINGLDAMLVAPDGRKAMLLSDVGGYNHVANVTLTLDDEAGTALSDAIAPTSGRYRPTNFGGGDTFPAPAPNASTAGTPLSVFDGGNPNGTWKLYVVQDESDQAAGLISAGWSLRITTTGSSAPRISSTKPATHATGVKRSADIRAVASKALKPSTVTGKTVYLTRAGSSRHLPATISYLAGSRTILIDPSRRLKAGTKYRVVVTTDVRDTAGHRLDQDPSTTGIQPKTWKFRTR